MLKSKRVIRNLLIVLCAVSLCGCSLPGKTEKKQGKGTVQESGKPVQREYTREEALRLAGKYMEGMTDEEKVGQLFIVNLEQLDTSRGNYYEWQKATKKMKQALAKYYVGGIVLFSRNIATRKQTKKMIQGLQEASPISLFVAVDEEGGDVARIGGNPDMGTTSFPTMEEVGKTKDAEYTKAMAHTIGQEIGELGFNVDFAPVADVRTSDLNKEIGSRSFGDDPKMVAEHVEAFVEAIQEENISATVKHFPGQGSSLGDTHIESVNIDKSISGLRGIDFVPFEEGIEAGADFVMVSHISVSKVTETSQPASMSDVIMNTLLREELGFDGVIVTDAMDMVAITDNYSSAEAAYDSFRAGADIILMPADFEKAYCEILDRVKDGKIDSDRLDASVTRIIATKIQRNLLYVE